MVSMGDTYWGKNPYSSLNKQHLYFVINTPTEDKLVVLVNMTERGNISDTSCVLHSGEHKRINKESVINYGQCLAPTLQNFKSSIRDDIFTSDERAETRLIKKIQKGALKSAHFPDRYENIIVKALKGDN